MLEELCLTTHNGRRCDVWLMSRKVPLWLPVMHLSRGKTQQSTRICGTISGEQMLIKGSEKKKHLDVQTFLVLHSKRKPWGVCHLRYEEKPKPYTIRFENTVKST